MVLSSSKKEQFAQLLAKGQSPCGCLRLRGYSKAGARQSAARLLRNADIFTRIKELKTAIASGVVAAEIRRRSWRLLQLQGLVDDILALRGARRLLYTNHLGEGYDFEVADGSEEAKAVAEGCRALPPANPDAPEYPKLMRPRASSTAATPACWSRTTAARMPSRKSGSSM